MDSYQIYKNADRLIQHYGTNDPIELCDDMGIMLRDEPDFTDLLGMYTYRWKHRIMILSIILAL